ncbi:hypothetical protein AC578_6771 [Pseudocercospora eumusae]|uniref:Uncharacterized protein n=1 Tax=Pseudocercospora eumusae TaxID=321146 RepID=A0A139GYX5_9PEZI|nr:hypothetical protein AC578_6771 [Pseudocercospora eumusae]
MSAPPSVQTPTKQTCDQERGTATHHYKRRLEIVPAKSVRDCYPREASPEIFFTGYLRRQLEKVTAEVRFKAASPVAQVSGHGNGAAQRHVRSGESS